MLTYDSRPQSPDDELRALARSSLPDEIEVAETQEHWVRVRRSGRLVVLVSKVTGFVSAAVPADDASVLGLSDRHLAAARQALDLREVAR